MMDCKAFGACKGRRVGCVAERLVRVAEGRFLVAEGPLRGADAFDGYNQLYKAQRKPAPKAACWSHGRRKFFDLAKSGEAPIGGAAHR
jgi:hypothetical protein